MSDEKEFTLGTFFKSYSTLIVFVVILSIICIIGYIIYNYMSSMCTDSPICKALGAIGDGLSQVFGDMTDCLTDVDCSKAPPD